jgi:hypothetical protein
LSRQYEGSDGGFQELMQVLMHQFGAVEVQRIFGPYSMLVHLDLNGILLGLHLNSPDWIDLFPRDERTRTVMLSLVEKLLDALNGQD